MTGAPQYAFWHQLALPATWVLSETVLWQKHATIRRGLDATCKQDSHMPASLCAQLFADLELTSTTRWQGDLFWNKSGSHKSAIIADSFARLWVLICRSMPVAEMAASSLQSAQSDEVDHAQAQCQSCRFATGLCSQLQLWAS